MSNRVKGCIVVAAMAASLAAAVHAQECPQWLGPNRDGHYEQKDIATQWPADGPRQIWQAKLGDGWGAPIAADGKVWVHYTQGKTDYVACFDAASGREVWKQSYENKARISHGNCPRSTPLYNDGRLYTLGADGKFICWDANRGQRLWDMNILQAFDAKMARWGVSCSPLIEGDALYLCAGGKRGAFVALDKKTGRPLWATGRDPASYSSPIGMTLNGRRVILFFTAKGLTGVDARTGNPLWSHAWKTSYDVNAATPMPVGDDKVLITSGYGTGSALLHVSSSGVRELWRTKEMDGHISTPIVVGAYAYGFRGKMGKNNAELVCLDLRTGRKTWAQQGFKTGHLVAVGDTLVVLGESGKLATVKADPQRYTEVSSFEVSRGSKYAATPVFADGRMIIRLGSDLVAYDVKK